MTGKAILSYPCILKFFETWKLIWVYVVEIITVLIYCDNNVNN